MNYLSGNKLQAVVYYVHVPVYGLQARVKNSDLLEAVSSTKLKNNYSWEAVNCIMTNINELLAIKKCS